MKDRKTSIRCLMAVLVALAFLPLTIRPSRAERSPLTESHITAINTLFRQNHIVEGYVDLDRYGRAELKGEYGDEGEVDRAFSLAQTVVGIKWVSPVTPENIKVKEWEKRLGRIFSRAKILKPEEIGAGPPRVPSQQMRGGVGQVLKPEETGTEPPGPVRNKYALVVGIGKFLHGLTELKYSVSDATNFSRFLLDPERGGFSKGNVIFLTNQDATRNNVANALERIKNLAEANDLVVIYISSHGTPPEKFGGVFIVTYDTEVKPRERVWQTAVGEALLKDFVENLKSKRLIMILDACYSNSAYRYVPGFLPSGGKSLGAEDDEGYGISKEYGKRLIGAKDIIVEEEPEKTARGSRPPGPVESSGWGKVLIGASGAGEQSWESESLRNSIFTYYFLNGLNQYDGSIQNAFYYAKPLVYRRVKQEKGEDIDQNPQVVATNRNWNMYLSRTRSP